MGVIGLLTCSLFIQHPEVNHYKNTYLDVNDVSWIHTAIKLKLAALTVVPSTLDILNGLDNYFIQVVISQYMFWVTVLLQDDNEYVIFFFQSSHKLMFLFLLVFCFKKLMGEKNSLNFLFFFTPSHS